ncbi:MAG: hypothetical protein WCA96_01725 [Methylocella sp.]
MTADLVPSRDIDFRQLAARRSFYIDLAFLAFEMQREPFLPLSFKTAFPGFL